MDYLTQSTHEDKTNWITPKYLKITSNCGKSLTLNTYFVVSNVQISFFVYEKLINCLCAIPFKDNSVPPSIYLFKLFVN